MNEFLIGIAVFIIASFLGYNLVKYKKWYIGKSLLKYFIVMIIVSIGMIIVFGNGYASLTILAFVSFLIGQFFGKDPNWTNL